MPFGLTVYEIPVRRTSAEDGGGQYIVCFYVKIIQK